MLVLQINSLGSLAPMVRKLDFLSQAQGKVALKAYPPSKVLRGGPCTGGDLDLLNRGSP
jgi:hypothetical protein